MECPYCGKEMEKGYIQSRDVLSWSRKKVLIAALSGLVADTTLSYTVIGYRCSTCKKILIDYEEEV